jgi:cellulose synthase/poly-beta-1,6-N-acetylglucosamine synthase-like glycosyltransferase
MVDVLVLILTSSYVTVVLYLLHAFSRVRSGGSKATPFVSVIVAARNEETALPALLSALQSQSYPQIEILIVNDRSTDQTARIVADAAVKQSRIRLVNIVERSEILPPKKNALTVAIQQSRGEIICLTDADCIPPSAWVERLVEYFEPEVGMVAGFSPYNVSEKVRAEFSAFQKVLVNFVRFEEILTSFLAASCSHSGFPWLCSGRNLAYRREVFDAVGGFSSSRGSVSGDDDLLLQAVRSKTRWKIVYALEEHTFVPTTPPTTATGFLHQRLRHFSDGKYYLLSVQGFLFWYHASNLAILVYFVMGLVGIVNLAFGCTVLGVKLMIDGYTIVASSKRFAQPASWTSFVPNEILYVLYNVLIGPLGFFEKFSWKK